VAVQTGGSNVTTKNSYYRAAITTQPMLPNSNGTTWWDMDPGLSLTITPRSKCVGILTANADLWTDTAGFNQDMGITVSGGIYPSTANQPEAWKESGGLGGTFSPDAAFLQTALPLSAGIAYTFKLNWKTNRNALGATIWAGAGPINGKFSPTSLSAYLIPVP
jgi:hypothetical protein